MNENVKDCKDEVLGNVEGRDTKPMRRTAMAIVVGQIEHFESKVAGLKQIKKILDHADPGSPLEVIMWELLERYY
jgi:hypothetical protein